MSEMFESLTYYDRSGLPSDWAKEASCRGTETNLFYPERGENTREAVAICAGCLVVEQCLHYALSNNIKTGVWGGKSEKQRRVLRRERNGR